MNAQQAFWVFLIAGNLLAALVGFATGVWVGRAWANWCIKKKLDEAFPKTAQKQATGAHGVTRPT